MEAVSRILVEVQRAGKPESVHSGWIVVVDHAGSLIASAGSGGGPVFARSTLKPFQALPLLLSGAAERYALNDQELAVICSSHSGEEEHVSLVRSLLARAGLPAAALKCGNHWPLQPASADALKRAGQEPSALHCNCSGKHAGMLLLCRYRSWPVATYLRPDHPVQQLIRDIVARCCEMSPESLIRATDGCSAPVYALPLANLALAYARFAAPEVLPRPWRAHLRRLAQAMSANPRLVAGTDRFDTLLMATNPGLVSKSGAEGVHAVACPARGWGLALKIADGQQRAVAPAVVEALRQLRLLDGGAVKALASFHRPELRNHLGLPVGQIRPRVRLTFSQIACGRIADQMDS